METREPVGWLGSCLNGFNQFNAFQQFGYTHAHTHTYTATVLISFELSTGAFLTLALCSSPPLIKLIQTPLSAR